MEVTDSRFDENTAELETSGFGLEFSALKIQRVKVTSIKSAERRLQHYYQNLEKLGNVNIFATTPGSTASTV